MKMESEKFVPDANCNWEKAGEGMRRKILGYNGSLMMVKVEFEEGSIGYIHKHVHNQVTYVAAGKFEVEIDGEKRILTEGDSFMMPSDVPHGVKALKPGCLIDVFSPLREDFLNQA